LPAHLHFPSIETLCRQISNAIQAIGDWFKALTPHRRTRLSGVVARGRFFR